MEDSLLVAKVDLQVPKLPVILHEMSFTAGELQLLPGFHASFAVASSLAVSEVTMLMRIMTMATVAQIESRGNDTLMRYAASQLVTIERLLSAKCFEYLNLLDDYAKKCDRRGDQLGRAQGLKLSAVVARVRADPNYATSEWLRNKITSHFDLTEIGRLIGKPPKDHRLSIYLHDQDGNSLYPLGDDLTFMGKMNEDGKALENYGAWREWNLGACRTLIGVHHAFMIDLLQHFFPEKRPIEVPLEVEQGLVGDVGKTTLPLFFDFAGYNRKQGEEAGKSVSDMVP